MSQPTATPYHHGNLRAALQQAAIDIIRNDGVEKLSLRALARTVGVSQTAPYRHFQDKNHLLAEIAQDTFEELTQALQATINPHQSAASNVYQCGTAYLNYALHNPERYKLMFGSLIEQREQYPELINAGLRSLGVLHALVEQGIKQGEFLNQPPHLLTNACWSSIHGFASLTFDGFYQRQQCLPDDFATLRDNQLQLSIRMMQRQPDASQPPF